MYSVQCTPRIVDDKENKSVNELSKMKRTISEAEMFNAGLVALRASRPLASRPKRMPSPDTREMPM